jgi:hypothetical protein
MGSVGRSDIPAAASLPPLGAAGMGGNSAETDEQAAEMDGNSAEMDEQAAEMNGKVVVKGDQAAETDGQSVVKRGQLVVNCDLVSFAKTLSSWYRDV